MRALGTVGSEACPEYLTVLGSPPILGRIIAQLRRFMGDGETTVREAVAESFGTLAAGMYDSSTGVLPGAAAANPLLRAALEGMADSRKEAQMAAGMALAQVRRRSAALSSSAIALSLCQPPPALSFLPTAAPPRAHQLTKPSASQRKTPSNRWCRCWRRWSGSI